MFQRFQKGGFIADNTNAYTLHLTLMNTSHRKPLQRGTPLPKKRIPFDATSLFDAPAGTFDLGEYIAPEICIARMGSYSQNGAYITSGGISLLPPVLNTPEQTNHCEDL